MSIRGTLVLSLLWLAACPGEVPPRDSADASLDLADASPGAPDARPTTPDARPDAATTTDAAITCTFNDGRQGICISTTECQAMGKESEAGHCPGPTNIQCCAARAMASEICEPTERPQPNEGLSEEPGVDGCPAGMLLVHGATSFCIDRFEASLVEVGADGSTTPWSPYFNPGTTRVAARSLRGAVPQGYITGEQAKKACAESGKRLCTDVEWQRACGGPDGTTYPYGPTLVAGLCNDARAQHPAVELFGSVTNLNSPCINQLEDGLERTGSFTGCVTAEGAFDMMGNLHEWTADPNGTFRGGFYVDTYRNGPGCRYTTTAHNTLHHDYSTGFRCCADRP
jgi:hypothetical protein